MDQPVSKRCADALCHHPAVRWGLLTLMTLGVLSGIYRLRLAAETASLADASSRGALLLVGTLEDIGLAGVGAIFVVLVVGVMVVAHKGPPPRWLRVTGATLLAIASLMVAAIYQSHLGAVAATGEGLTFAVASETASAGFLETTRALWAMVGVTDLLFIAAPLVVGAVLWLALRSPRALRRGALAIAGVPLLCGSAGLLLPKPGLPDGLARALRDNPIHFVARDVAASVDVAGTEWPALLPRRASALLASVHGARQRLRRQADDALAAPRGRRLPGATPRMPFATQLTSVSFVHPLLVSNVRPTWRSLSAPKAGEPPWNVLFVLMESTGLRYAFSDKVGGKVPMPYLKQLAARGLQLDHHFSPSNSSPRSIFSLFTGLYPMPEVRIFAMSKGLHLPTIYSRLPKAYDTFFVSPAPLTWYFPTDLMKRHGPKDIYDYENLPIRGRVARKAMAKDEEKTVSFFLDRLDRVGKRPFFAVYYSYVAHWPYPDFAGYRRYNPKRKINRYLNNLYLLDSQIARIVKHLEKRGLAERTIFVFVGDHGEAFGQHKGNWTHARHSYNENYQAPAVFYQPKLFKPRRVKEPTSHVDVMPTLLDAMGLSYNARLIQGESLFQDVFRRRQVFLWGNENTLSAVGKDGIKLQLAFRKRACWVYDLRQDPDERRRLKCRPYPKAYEATVLFKRTQPDLLRAYNNACRDRRPFHGQGHPPRGARRR